MDGPEMTCVDCNGRRDVASDKRNWRHIESGSIHAFVLPIVASEALFDD